MLQSLLTFIKEAVHFGYVLCIDVFGADCAWINGFAKIYYRDFFIFGPINKYWLNGCIISVCKLSKTLVERAKKVVTILSGGTFRENTDAETTL